MEIDFNKLQRIAQPTKFEKVILPDRAFGGGFTNEYRETMDCLRNFAIKNRTPISNKKIYYFYGRKQIGEERLAEYFNSKGYAIISPEKLTFDEQLNILVNTESFASTLGSCSHNSIFLRDGTETIFIPRTFNAFTGYQQTIDQVHPLRTNYIDSTLSIFTGKVYEGAHCYIISKQLKQFFGDKFDGYEEEDFKTFLYYVNNSIREGLTIKTDKVEGYSAVFTDFMEQLKQREDLITFYNMLPNWEKFQQSLPKVLSYQTHVHKRGWRDGWKSDNQFSNPIDQKLDIQAIKINFPNHKVYYSVYYNEAEGWSKEVVAPKQAGTTGKTKSIFGIKIRLDETGLKEFDILYRVHKFDDMWTPWAKNGEEIISDGVKLNAIQIKLEPKPTAEKA